MTCPGWQHSSLTTPARSDLTFLSGGLGVSAPFSAGMGTQSANTVSTLTWEPGLTFHSKRRQGSVPIVQQISDTGTTGPSVNAPPQPPPPESAAGSSICERKSFATFRLIKACPFQLATLETLKSGQAPASAWMKTAAVGFNPASFCSRGSLFPPVNRKWQHCRLWW